MEPLFRLNDHLKNAYGNTLKIYAKPYKEAISIVSQLTSKKELSPFERMKTIQNI